MEMDVMVLSGKWCIKGSKELEQWQLVNMKNSCNSTLSDPHIYYNLDYNYLSLFDWNWSTCIPNGYIEISFDEFEKQVVELINRERKEKIKTGNWCIKGSDELGDWQVYVMDDKCDECLNDTEGYYYLDHNQNLYKWIWISSEPKNKMLITFDEFKKYIVNQDYMNMEIIGYKFKPESESYNIETIAKAAAILCDYDSNIFIEYNDRGLAAFTADSDCAICLKNSNVLDLWFDPVYKKYTPNIIIDGHKIEFGDDGVDSGKYIATKEIFTKLTVEQFEQIAYYYKN